jgi:succinate dehydrogenase/fumarate reductase cytochrome b subunit
MVRDTMINPRFFMHWTESGLHKAHRVSASIIGVYVLAHLINHLFALDGISAHVHLMETLRHVYRNALVEPILWMAVTFQSASGLYFIKARWGERAGFFDRLQALSGAYLAFFLLVHLAAIAFGRIAFKLDTNFYYAAAGMHIAPFHLFFFSYYFLAVFAFFAHIACAMHWLLRERISKPMRNTLAFILLAIGITVSALIVLAFGGAFYTVTIPPQYRMTYQ